MAVVETLLLQPHDLHALFSPAGPALAVWNARHEVIMRCEARNRTTANGQLGHDGNIPPGEYRLGVPVPKNTVPFGAWFIPIEDYNGFHAMADHGRAGIGLHGGGSGLANPFADHQGFQLTHGCIRLQNVDLRELVRLVKIAQAEGGQVYLTVPSPLPGAVPNAAPTDWAPVCELAPDE